MMNWSTNMYLTIVSRQMENNTMWISNTNLESWLREEKCHFEQVKHCRHHHHHHYYYYIIILLLFDSHFMTSSINKEPKTKHNYTLEIKSDTNALTLFASSEPHMWTRFQTACTISWSACQHVSPITSFTFFSPRQISPTSNFLWSAWRLQEQIKVSAATYKLLHISNLNQEIL